MIQIYKVIFRTERCKGCTLCETVCPKKIISMSNKLNELGYYVAEIEDHKKNDCIGCGFCFRMCPDSVITILSEDSKKENEQSESVN